MQRILILTPWIPFPVTGADQQDRFFGMLQMKSLGYDITVIAKVHQFQHRSEVEAMYEKTGIPLRLFPHPTSIPRLILRNLPRIVMNPGLLDGATLEYLEPEYLAGVDDAIRTYKPDVIWVEYTTHWSILKHLKSFGIPVIVKSSLNEPRNCRAENGNSLLSRLKSLPKYIGEKTAARQADLLLAITPDEEQWYRSLGATATGVLPLRGLSTCFTKKTHIQKDVLDIVFLSSNYNMGHNRDALRFLLHEIVPHVRSVMPGKFRFHLTGSKFPERERARLGHDVIYEGFILDLAAFLATMDIAVCPWISGHGMQQKVFEPLCRSLPTLTTHTGGYPFRDHAEIQLCTTPEDYAERLRKLLSAEERNTVAQAAYEKAYSLFSDDAVKQVMRLVIERVTTAGSSRTCAS